MRGQRNMAHMKEQNSRKRTEQTGDNLSHAGFKILVIRMVKELIGYFNSIKKTQAEMKVTLSEIKENLQGTNSGVDEAENQISDWEYKEEDGVALTFVRANSQAEMKE